jgi:hypothetical protein
MHEVINDNGVKGILNKLDNFVPLCCYDCSNLESEYTEGYFEYSYCGLGLYFPTKKGTCKKQVIWRKKPDILENKNG